MNSQAITPELREWIVAQARAGCRPEDVLQSMRTSGWDEDTAVDALETTLQEYLAAQPAAQVLPPPVPVPGPTCRQRRACCRRRIARSRC